MAKMFINGNWADALSGKTYEVRNPANGKVADTVPESGQEDVEATVQAAQAAFPGWADTSPDDRAAILRKGLQAVESQAQEIAAQLTAEQGKPLFEGSGELHHFLHGMEFYAGLASKIRGAQIPLPHALGKNAYGLVLRRPVGVCTGIVPWNFPLTLMGTKVGPALIAGNPIIIKPARTTPLATLKVIGLLNEAGLPPGVLQCLTGSGSVVGEGLIGHPAVRRVALTGSSETGRRVMQLAGPDFKRITLELGGSDPCIICPDANVKRAVSGVVVGRYWNAGQQCLAIKRLYLFERIYDTFVQKLVEKTKKLKVANGLEKDARLGPLHTAAQREEVEEQVADAVKRGAQILAGGKRPEGAAYEKGFFYLPTLLVDVPDDARIAQEECFGPALPVFKVKDWEEALARANNSVYGLGSSVWSRDLSAALRAAERLESGYTWINSAQIIYDELPFGGVKWSGLGKEHGSEALDYYLETKSVVVGPT